MTEKFQIIWRRMKLKSEAERIEVSIIKNELNMWTHDLEK